MTNAAAKATDRQAMGQAERAGRALVAGELPAVAAPAPKGRHRWFSRAAVLGALGALTIVGPLAGANASTPAAEVSAVTAATESTVVTDLASGAAELPEATKLSADPEAQARVIEAASRDQLRQSRECPVQSVANGALAAATGGEDPTPDLVMPVAEGTYRVTSTYGPRSYPFPGMHEGTDFAGALGTPLYAVAEGTVIYVGGGKQGRSGTLVIIRAEVNGATYDFWYGHMYTSGVFVSQGQKVGVGQKIAEIGNNGRSTGPHVHFEVHDANDRTVDPYAFLKSNGAEATGAAARCA